mmetsp:Transcript_19098/g.61098  ORF Transcript_19098/g.61098 Transcript_19098/m.61098 type:complete len:228 (+) Transcript_19098:391-1074(+)
MAIASNLRSWCATCMPSTSLISSSLEGGASLASLARSCLTHSSMAAACAKLSSSTAAAISSTAASEASPAAGAGVLSSPDADFSFFSFLAFFSFSSFFSFFSFFSFLDFFFFSLVVEEARLMASSPSPSPSFFFFLSFFLVVSGCACISLRMAVQSLCALSASETSPQALQLSQTVAAFFLPLSSMTVSGLPQLPQVTNFSMYLKIISWSTEVSKAPFTTARSIFSS